MSCGCKKQVYNNIQFRTQLAEKTPIEFCLNCIEKHLNHAFVIFQSKKNNAIGQIYAAYNHCKRWNKDLSQQIFTILLKLIKDDLQFQYFKDAINNIKTKTWQSVQLKTVQQKEDILSNQQKILVYKQYCYTLLKQISYYQVNKDYIISYLTLIEELIQEDNERQWIRKYRITLTNSDRPLFWKNIFN